MNREVRDMWIGSLLLTLAISLPLLVVSDDPMVTYVLSLIADLIIVWYFGTRLAKAGVFDKQNQEINVKHLLILLPICISFLAMPIYFLLNSSVVIFGGVDTIFWLHLLQIILIALSEEMFFRIIVYSRINKESRLLNIVLSAGIFALFELITFFQTFSLLSTIANMIAAFVLGIFLGFIREYTHSIYPCFVFHFLFLFFEELFPTLFFIFGESLIAPNLLFILPIALKVIALVYLALVYIFYFVKKEDINNVF